MKDINWTVTNSMVLWQAQHERASGNFFCVLGASRRRKALFFCFRFLRDSLHVMKNPKINFVLAAFPLFLAVQPLAHAAPDQVNDNLIQFNQNGVWTWYSDERTVVDTNGGKIVVGYVENGYGLGGFPVDGN